MELEFHPVIEAAAQKEGYSVNRLMIDGNAFVRTPQKADMFEYTFKLPEGINSDEYKIVGRAYRESYKKFDTETINFITWEELCKEQVRKIKRVIISSTCDWDVEKDWD